MVEAEFPLSSTVRKASYDPEREELVVTFKNGSYAYSGVPSDVADGLFSAPSAGSYVSSALRDQYPTRRL